MQSIAKPFSIREALRVGWRTTIKNIGPFSLILLAGWVVSYVGGFFSPEVGGVKGLLGMLISFLAWIALILIQMGFIRSIFKTLKEEKPAVADFSSSFNQFLNFFLASLFTGIITLLGFVALIIPGVILAARLQFYSYLVIDRNMAAMDAIKTSWRMTKGNTWSLFLFTVIIGLMVILGALLFGIGLILAIPISMVATAFIYKKFVVLTDMSLDSELANEIEEDEPKEL